MSLPHGWLRYELLQIICPARTGSLGIKMLDVDALDKDVDVFDLGAIWNLRTIYHPVFIFHNLCSQDLLHFLS